MVQENSGQDIIIQQRGAVGHVVLNRPKALNALNMDMIRGLSFALTKWLDDDSIKVVFIEGAGERAFCAGGDIKGFYMAGMDYRRGKLHFDVAMLFFHEEYALNKQIFHYPKPIISFMNGITMGGGFGIAGHCRYRIVCEDTVFAMPETKIGFFPDVGSMVHLTRMPDHTGLYLALSGESIGAADMVYAGVAEAYVKRSDKTAFFDDMCNGMPEGDADEIIKGVLARYGQNADLPESPLKSKAGYIEEVYAPEGGVVSLIKRLDKMRASSADAAYDYKILTANAPMSLLVTYEYYQKARAMGFDEVIEQDFRLACNFAKGRDFYEGIRAAVIDKDRSPNWAHRHIQDIDGRDAEVYFL